MDRFLDWAMPRFLVVAVGAVLLGIGGVVFDGFQNYRSFDDQVACRQQDKDALRRFLSAEVVCVNRIPYPLKVDVR